MKPLNHLSNRRTAQPPWDGWVGTKVLNGSVLEPKRQQVKQIIMPKSKSALKDRACLVDGRIVENIIRKRTYLLRSSNMRSTKGKPLKTLGTRDSSTAYQNRPSSSECTTSKHMTFVTERLLKDFKRQIHKNPRQSPFERGLYASDRFCFVLH